MTPYTLADAERDLRAALDSGETAHIAIARADLARLDPMERALHEPVKGAIGQIGAALWYAQHGLPVFPLQPGLKTPYPGTRGVKDATTSPDVIWHELEARPGSNLGLATGHLVDVIDFDGPDAHRAWGEQWPDWLDAGLEVLGTVSTPRPGGLHVYVAATGRGNRAGVLPGVDYRGLGGYVVVPPSVTELGPYRWLRHLELP